MWRRWLPVVILFLLVLLGVWFWSLGSLPKAEEARITLHSLHGSVEVKTPNETDWHPAQDGQMVGIGDWVRTGADGKATIAWYGLGESTLGRDAFLALQAAAPLKGSEELQVEVRLESGRVWTRLLRLVDLDAGFLVETPDVVATVRGTSFDVRREALRTEVWVAESAVDVRSGTSALIVPDARMAAFGKGLSATGTTRIASLPGDDWQRENLERDRAFMAESHEAMQARVALDRVPTNRTLQRLALLSERLHTRLGKKESRDAREAVYIVRRMAQARRTAEGGRSGLAYQEWARFEAEMKARLGQEGGEAARAIYHQAFVLGARLYTDVMPETPAYRLKQELEDARLSVAVSALERIAVHLSVIGARLDEGREALRRGSMPQARQMATIADQGLQNISREIDDADLADGERLNVRRTAASLVARTEALLADVEAFEQAKAVPVEVLPETTTSTATSTLPEVLPTSTAPTATTTVPTPPAQPPVPRPVSINISPSQASVPMFSQLPFSVRLVLSDGLTRDVTAVAKMSLSDLSRGSVTRGQFTAGQTLGGVTLIATYEEAGVKMMGTASLTIVDR